MYKNKINEFLHPSYLDASVMVKLFIDEKGHEIVRKFFNDNTWFYSTSFCFTEALSVLKVKYTYRNEINQKQYIFALRNLWNLATNNNIRVENIDFSKQNSFSKCEEIIKRDNIDFIDAMQIITIKNTFSLLKLGTDSEPLLITADSNLAKTAKYEGIRVWSCLEKEYK